MARRKGRSKLERALDAFEEATGEPTSDAAREAMRSALASEEAPLVTRAAERVRDHPFDGIGGALVDAFERFLEGGAQADPGCRAKVALLEAMNATEVFVHAPYLAGARCVQKEAAWGPAVDTAAPVRASSILALATSGYADLVVLAGELAADPLPPVRRAALSALAVHGERAGAGVAGGVVAHGDDDPLVVSEAMATLLALAPDFGLEVLGAALEGADATGRELALVTLGESRRPEALELILGHLARAVLAEERRVVFTALALHRSEPALEALLSQLRAGRARDARAAIEALAIRRFEPDVVERARAAARAHPEDLDEPLAEAFGAPGR